jgi:gamma-glutamylcyclotransferase (GGCT)/AIG2-like uncharacterized protein YtfP
MWYFAYGSNLLTAQLTARTGHDGAGAKRAFLPGYRLVFNAGGRFANIESPGRGVRGVIYPFDEKKLAEMDHFEEGYDREMVEVFDEAGERVRAFVYIAKPTHTAIGRPAEEYLDRILRGAREHGLPEEYILTIASS